MDCSPRCCKESDTTEVTLHACMACIFSTLDEMSVELVECFGKDPLS